MSTTLTSRLAEHLVCAELARRKLIATTFTHNVPKFDVLVADEDCRTVPLQIKATTSESWRTSADIWVNITLNNANETQVIGSDKSLMTPELIWVCVAVAAPEGRDRYFILTARDVQKICIANHRQLLEKCSGHRPKNWKSLDCWWDTADLKSFENNWDLIVQRLKSGNPDRSLLPSMSVTQ